MPGTKHCIVSDIVAGADPDRRLRRGCVCSGPAAAQGKPWRHALIQPKSDAGILLMAAQGGFFKKVGLNVTIQNVKDDEIMLHAYRRRSRQFEGGPGAGMMRSPTAPTSRSSAVPG